MSAPLREVRFGVIGCGVIAYWTHLRELRHLAGARLVAAADPDPAARAKAGRLTGIPVHEDAAELLQRADVDAVVICAPTHLHAELGIAAAQAGKHFYLEKPVAANRADGQRLASAVCDAGVAVAIGFNRRCHPLHLQAREIIAGGSLGAVRAVLTTFCEPVALDAMPGWKRRRSSGGGVLLDLASHHCDLLRWFLQDEAAWVEARIHSRTTEGDEAWMNLTMRGGVEAHGYFSFLAGRTDFLEFIGERGTLRVDRHRAGLSLRVARRFGYGVRSRPILPKRDALAWRMVRMARPSYEPSYRRALADFVRVIQGGRLQGASLEDGLRSLDMVLAAEESARTLRPASPHAPGI